jgi:hypothetical protein
MARKKLTLRKIHEIPRLKDLGLSRRQIANRLSLRGDPLPWLLEQENPPVRSRTLMEIPGRPVGRPVGRLENDPDVKEATRAISRLPRVQELFALQHPGSYWGDDEAKPYTARGTLGVLSFLHMLGAQPDSRTAAGCDPFLRFSQHESGRFSMTRTRRSGIFPCTTGEHLPFLVYFGCGGDPRVRSAFAFLMKPCPATAHSGVGAVSTRTACGEQLLH